MRCCHVAWRNVVGADLDLRVRAVTLVCQAQRVERGCRAVWRAHGVANQGIYYRPIKG